MNEITAALLAAKAAYERDAVATAVEMFTPLAAENGDLGLLRAAQVGHVDLSFTWEPCSFTAGVDVPKKKPCISSGYIAPPMRTIQRPFQEADSPQGDGLGRGRDGADSPFGRVGALGPGFLEREPD